MIQGAIRIHGNAQGWETEALGRCLRQVKDFNDPEGRLLGVSLVHGVRPREDDDGRPAASVDKSGYKRVAPGDIIMNALGKPHGSIGRSPVQGITSPAYWVLRPLHSLDGRFAHHLLRSPQLLAEYNRLGKNLPPNQFDLSWELFREIEVPVPPLEEQQRIADFLDDQTTRIDQIIAARRQQLDLLAEARQSELDTILTGQLHTILRPPDWEPFAGLPAHWREGRLRSVNCEVQTGPFGSQLHADEYVDGGIPIVNPANITATGLVALPDMAVDEATRGRLRRHVLQLDDVVFGRRGDLGRAGLVTDTEVGWVCGTGSLVVRISDPALLAEYLVKLLRTRPLRHYFESQSVGSTMANLNTGILMAMPLPLPPPEEQRQLVELADGVEHSFDAMTSTLSMSIDALQELKRSLISAAVLGEFDVSSASGWGVPA